MKTLKVIVEKHSDGYVAYPLVLQGAVVAEGDTYEEALADAKSAAQFHIETFGLQVLAGETDFSSARGGWIMSEMTGSADVPVGMDGIMPTRTSALP